jgi:hypothetical protein
MDRAWRLVLVAAGVAVAAALFFVLRDNGNDNGKGATPTQTATGNETTTAGTPLPPPPPPKPLVATIVYRNGRVVGGLRNISTTKGKRVTIVVNGDVSDEVHVHGYNVKGDVAPGAPARITFRANLVGQFAIELESRGFQIANLEVEP